MSFMDELRKLTRPYEEDEDEYIDDAERIDEPEPERAKPNPFASFIGGGAREEEPPAPAPQSVSPIRPIRQKEGRVVSLGGNDRQMQVVLVRPERFETAAEIADHLRDKRAVLVNLETTPKDVTRRLVDFLSGVAYATDGKVKKIAANTYIITPPSIDLMGDMLDELGSSGVYF